MKQFFKGVVCLLMLPLFIQQAIAQCTSSSAHGGITAASVSFTGSRFGYDIPNNALNADNIYATATAILAVLSGPTQNLTITNFGLSVPSSATICGVVVDVKKKAANINVLSTVSDNSVKLVKAGAVSGNNKALVGNWTTTNTSFAYGGVADTWGLSLTPADVNASNFGVAFSAFISGTISLIPSALIDHIQLTVYYTLSALPVVLSDFKASSSGNKVLLQWKSEEEVNFSHYEIERSNDGYHFEKIASVPSSLSKEYSYLDAWPEPKSYYRLRMVDIDDRYKYSPTVFVSVRQQKNQLVIRPNPASSNCSFNFCDYEKGEYRLEVVNSNGQVVCKMKIRTTKDLSLPVNLNLYSKGLYIVNVYSDENKLVSSAKLLKQ